jgi:catechol 2,3-dioxygenase
MSTSEARRLVPRGRSARPIDPGVDIGHVHMKSADLGKVRAFYVDVLGFDVVAELPEALFLSAGGYHHNLAFNTWESAGGPRPPANATGLYHIAIRYPTRAALGDALGRLVDADWALDGMNDHGTHEALYLRDGEGNGLELCWDRPVAEWPLDDDGHLSFTGRRLDLEGLLAEGRAASE